MGIKHPSARGKRPNAKPWNKGIKGIHLSPSTEWKKGVIPKGAVLFGQGQNNYCPPEKRLFNEHNPRWKGDKAHQKTIHQWIKRKYGKAKVCEVCGSTENIGWANKYHTYKREIEDWMQVCLSCHRKYDIKNNDYRGGIMGLLKTI